MSTAISKVSVEVGAAADSQTFEVLLSRRAGVETALAALQKRAAKKGLTAARWTWGKAYTQKEHVPHPEYGWKVEVHAMVSRIPLTIEGDAPHYAGWSFLATLQHLDGENIVRAVPGKEVDVAFRTRGPVCDHCKTVRRRSDTFVLAHDDGRVVQVGSTCIDDFLGSADATKIAASASFLAEMRGLAEGGCSGGGSGGDRTLAEFLPLVAWSVREHGWMSRTAARDAGTSGATADEAFGYLIDEARAKKNGAIPTEADIAEGAAAEAWAEGLVDEIISKERGDYLHNLRAVARTGLITHRTAGIAGSMIVAYQRAMGRERERAARAAKPKKNEHVGTVGERTTFEVTLDFVTGYDTAYGYTTVLKFRTEEGVCIVWKASNTEISRSDVGKRFMLKGTVKKHDEYKGEKQTMVARCNLDEIKAGKSETAPLQDKS